MKKFISVFFALVFVLGLFNINANPAYGYDSGCTSAGPYSTTTGQLCTKSTKVTECPMGDLFSSLTGESCTAWRDKFSNNLTQEFKIGARGENVKAFQEILVDSGFLLGKVDGIYGPVTDIAAINYYKEYSISTIPPTKPCPPGTIRTGTIKNIPPRSICEPIPKDSFPPTVILTGPANGAKLSDTVTLSATAIDNVAVAGVTFKIDNTVIGKEITSAPYNIALDTKAFANGEHTLVAVARDTFKNTTVSLPSTVTISNMPSTPITYGWDYNLTKRCVKSTDPSGINYYKDTYQCTDGNKHWTIAVQSEKIIGGPSCPGPANQSLPINTNSSPLSIDWMPHTDEQGKQNWSVRLLSDFDGKEHPCGGQYFTWFVLMDHEGYEGGPFPLPNKIKTSATVNFNDFTPNGATRAFIGWQGYWGGKSHMIEVNLALKNWGDADISNADIINMVKNETTEFVAMDGSAMRDVSGKPIVIARLNDTKVEIPWYQIIQNLVDRGIFTSPPGGVWQAATTATNSVFIGTEVNNGAPSHSAMASLYFTNLRTESIDL